MFVFKLLKLKNKLKTFVFVILIILLTIFTIHFYRLINSYLDINNNINKSTIKTEFITEENIIDKLKTTNKLVTLEIELSQTIKIDKSFGSSELFSKYQYINFFADCSYYVDMSNLNKDDIIIDKLNNKLTLVIPKPEIYLISIKKDKTTLGDSVNGLFRFGDVNLSLDEISKLEENVYNSFKNIISVDDVYAKALSSSDIALKNFISQISEKDMEILLYFK